MKDQIFAKFLKVSIAVGSVCALAPLVFAQGIGTAELERRMVSTPQSVERGKALYEQNCAVCHGQNGQGKTGVQLAGAAGQSFNTVDFTKADYRLIKGPIQTYDVISFGLADAIPAAERPETLPPHPTFNFLQYQSRWDLVHYVRSLGPTAALTDPAEIIAKARERAEFGICDESVKETITDKVTPKGDEQIARGKEIYASTCASCHGDDGKGDGVAAAALKPHPRNFHIEDRDDWTHAPSALSVFNTITNGVPGTSMAAYSNLPEDDRWALTQLVLTWVPESVVIPSDESQIVAACRSLSAPEQPAAISVKAAMNALVQSQAEQRLVRQASFGTVRLQPGADPKAGEQVYLQNCAECHGVGGAGNKMGPYGAQPPYFYLSTDRLDAAAAGGSAQDFALRSYAQAHATLGVMSSAATLSKGDWANLQAYVATLGGNAEITVDAPAAAPVAPDAADQPDAESAE